MAVNHSITQSGKTEDFTLQLARGQINNHTHINKFGRNTAVASGATEEIWDGSYTYPFPSSATITHIRAAADSATTRSVVVEVQGSGFFG
jgi:hypothetical protein